MKKQQEKIIEKKVEKRLYGKFKGSASRFGLEFKKQIVVAISAALGFLVALSWREPIKEGVDLIIKKAGLTGNIIYYQFLSAILITLIAVLILMIVSKWRSED